MAVRQYIGARYVPIFGRVGEDSIQWDNTGPYEPLTVVLYQGNSYTSRQFVPVGIDITNEAYWAPTGTYNAQVEQYRQEVMTFNGRINQNASDIDTLQDQMADQAPSALKTAIVRVDNANIMQDQQLAGTSSSGLKTAIDANTDSITTLNSQLAGTSSSALKTSIDANTVAIGTLSNDLEDLSDIVNAEDELIWIGDSWSVRNDRLIPNAVAQILDMTLHCYAVSGTGWFTTTTPTFPMQANQAIADTSVNHEKVKLVIIYGGTNDFHYGSHEGSSYQSTISSTCAALKNAFPNATIHHFFNTCYEHGTDEYNKLNEQIHLFKDIGYYITDARACVPHADSAYWMINPSAFESDMLHPTINASKRLAGRIAKSVTGGAIEQNRYLDVKEIPLASKDGTVTGTAYVTAKDEFIEFCAYIRVAEDSTQTKGLGAGKIIPFDILRNASIGDVHNHLSVPLGKNGAIGMGILDVQMNVTSAGGDIIYLGQPNGSGVVSAGSYNGYGKFIMFV